MGLLKSLFTEHLATKFMSLLLAIVLFAIVQQQLEGTKVVDEITLQFGLVEELREDYSIITPTVVLINLRIKGRLQDVDARVEQFESASQRDINIDQRFLSRYAGKTEILVDENFLHEHNILPSNIHVVTESLTGLEKIRIEKNFDFRLELLPAATGNVTKLDDKGDYETRDGKPNVEVRFTPITDIKVRGPRSMFGGREMDKLYAVFGDVNQTLARGVDAEPKMRVTGFDYSNGINQSIFERHGHFDVGGRFVQFNAFKDILFVTFDVVPRKVSHTLSLPLVFIVDATKMLKPLDGFEEEGARGPVNWNTGDFEAGVASDFKIRYSRGRQRVKDVAELRALVLILDISRLDDSQPNQVRVPMRLGVKEPGQEELLKHVEIQMTEGEEGKTPYLIFRKKQ